MRIFSLSLSLCNFCANSSSLRGTKQSNSVAKKHENLLKNISNLNKLLLLFCLLISIPIILLSQQSSEPYFTGDGGKSTRLGILELQKTGLDQSQEYLPSLIQGVLVSTMSKYSAITVIDRVALDKVIEETLNPMYQDSWDIVRIGHVAHASAMMTGRITKTSTGYTLQINVTDTSPNGQTIASYSSNVSITQLESHSAILQAAKDILEQMGVQLTQRAIRELDSAISENQRNAQIAIAQGISAQRQGTEVKALSYFLQAMTYDASLIEAVNRSTILSRDIASGNIGEAARNLIQWRKDWEQRLRETENVINDFFAEGAIQYNIRYIAGVKPGAINYQRETVGINIGPFTFDTEFSPDILNQTLESVYNGLHATGRASEWGFASWPDKTVNPNKPLPRRVNANYKVYIQIVNNRNKVLNPGSYFEFAGTWELKFRAELNSKRIVPFYNFNTGTYNNRINKNIFNVTFGPVSVSAIDLTDVLTLRIDQINDTKMINYKKNDIKIMEYSISEYENFINEKYYKDTNTRYRHQN